MRMILCSCMDRACVHSGRLQEGPDTALDVIPGAKYALDEDSEDRSRKGRSFGLMV